jgi:PHD/YefM family antitoxin component YafN of YafNO toxin-antitoxin module
MTTMTATNFRKAMFSNLEQVVRYNEPLNIAVKNGDVVVISGDEYRGIVETLYLTSVKGMKEKILRASAEPKENCKVWDGRNLEEFFANV